MDFRSLTSEDIEVASRLIESVSDVFSRRDFSEKGYKNFKENVLDNGMRKNMDEGFAYWGAFESDTLVGLIAIKKPNHLFNLFVHQDYHHKGIASALWNYMLSQLQLDTVTVFSSSHAVGLYEALGFQHSGDKISNEEIICYPMLWSLC
ncbi:GNAT family N-acetyltransferase [Reichenbachiella sp.]|uniref:GNAT family N-acetyltransferase n=1 Tax=Reichenbachiella sp. TaxID=2184521 RepID=UPI003B58EE30